MGWVCKKLSPLEDDSELRDELCQFAGTVRFPHRLSERPLTPFLFGPFGLGRARTLMHEFLLFCKVTPTAATALGDEFPSNLFLRVMHAERHGLVAWNKGSRFQFFREGSFVGHTASFVMM